MHIQRHSAGVFLKLVIGLLSLAGLLYEWVDLDTAALRLFSFWLLLISTVYFLTISVKTVFMSHHPDHTRSPVLEGALLVAGAVMCVGFVMIKSTGTFTKYPICSSVESRGAEEEKCNVFWEGIGSPYLPVDNKASLNFLWPVIIYLFLPTLIFLDWILFTKKGRWRFVDPLYWLAPLVIYVSAILLTASNAEWGYPYRFLDYTRGENGIHDTGLWICFGGIMAFCFGYLLLLLDYTASGKLSKHIVLPHIRTVVVKEEEVSSPNIDGDHLAEHARLEVGSKSDQPTAESEDRQQLLQAGEKSDEEAKAPAIPKSKKKNTNKQQAAKSGREEQPDRSDANNAKHEKAAPKIAKAEKKLDAKGTASVNEREDKREGEEADPAQGADKKDSAAPKTKKNTKKPEPISGQDDHAVFDKADDTKAAKSKPKTVASEKQKTDNTTKSKDKAKTKTTAASAGKKTKVDADHKKKQTELQDFVVPTIIKKKSSDDKENNQPKVSRSPKIKKFASFTLPDEKLPKTDKPVASKATPSLDLPSQKPAKVDKSAANSQDSADK